MSIVKEKYNNNRINMIYQMLCNEAEQGHSKDYDVRVDELKVISRTNDPERFFQHEEFIQPDTRCLTICLYDGASRRCMRYVLLMKDDDQQPARDTLNGIEQVLSEKLKQERKQWEYELLLKENNELKQQLDEAEDYHQQLQEKVRVLQGEKSSTSSRITETVLSLAGLYLSKNPQALNGIPILGEMISTGVPLSSEPSGAASYTRVSSTPNTSCDSTDFQEKCTTDLRKILMLLFPEQYIGKVEHIIHCLHYNNELIDELTTILQRFTRQQEDEDEVNKRNGLFSQAA